MEITGVKVVVLEKGRKQVVNGGVIPASIGWSKKKMNLLCTCSSKNKAKRLTGGKARSAAVDGVVVVENELIHRAQAISQRMVKSRW